MSKAPPSFDFWYNDWLGGTRHLDHVTRACYLDLLIYQWQNGEIPRETPQRMALCQISDLGQWERIWRHVGDKFEVWDETGGLRNPKLAEIREKALARWLANKENGRKGGRPKKPKQNRMVSSGLTQTKPIGKVEVGSRKDTSAASINSGETVAPPYDTPEFAQAWQLWLDRCEEAATREPGKADPSKLMADAMRLAGLRSAETAIEWITHSCSVSSKGNLCDPQRYARHPPDSEAAQADAKETAERKARQAESGRRRKAAQKRLQDRGEA